MNLKGRNFLTLKDFTPEEITYLIDLSAELKAKKKAGELHEYYRGKNIALIFEKTCIFQQNNSALCEKWHGFTEVDQLFYINNENDSILHESGRGR
jgi:aspartate carbamoyltransferase catalytic subunit